MAASDRTKTPPTAKQLANRERFGREQGARMLRLLKREGEVPNARKE